MGKIDLSIVITSYNTKELLVGCLNSIFNNTHNLTYEVIVVDNASTDGSVTAIRKLQKTMIRQAHDPGQSQADSALQMKIITNKKNVGFGRATNQGINRANGKYVLLLNSDTIVKSNVLAGMAGWMDKRLKVGAATCALLNSDNTLQGTGGYFPSLFRVFAWMFFLDDIPLIDTLIKPFHPMHRRSPFYKGEIYYQSPREVEWITGAFMMLRKTALDKSGLFDEDYFMYTEDTDLCFRIKKYGWEVWYLPQWEITHLGGASSKSPYPILSEYAGIKLFYKKHYSVWKYPILRVILKAGALFRIIVFGLIEGKGAIKTYARAFVQA
ncbi:hypothetical protein A3A76_03590 [Candidatus Woesebacteria bacterium RIFCSPLOWO2_01_FULL_39_23]|uniref:Glycosyltransferase 2-like domain-containing protein n=1 Tax=Candidatus Woesebacteria bacterium RIFCSPHIGHO2_01_FULL_40_22 TaxID=1802499 RepID=A0A1F7YLR5_9BACT|nr:MAG: hypothetical protein A2141_00435 [Candidatus Woesebacteria bacterium RBG_16_40_11]OGM27538.1 MAG: hypothetical protein A2628_01990 [Candidatus Woesebacteria bacterium RIFCSPHIGHO2_01_FULL_40_22]OGM36130.1 MAG: hypothetical protein A3E41_02230 [Candidatus Woesebacteria bacterium RIFCSPHIGHO2_12_FULL_38_9]OGM62712.1 MAG: hypothetical protein A3A76_03590 [Candidatus Woesebacteria bacterium RIFCSPLOWO2_01_FULL_39_23]